MLPATIATPAAKARGRHAVPVLTVFDTATILAAGPGSHECAAPAALDPGTALRTLVPVGDGMGGNIRLRARIGDAVVWRGTSLSGNTGDAAILYALAAKRLFTPFHAVLERVQAAVPAPPGGCPCPYTCEPVTEVYWTARVFALGTAPYQGKVWIVTEDGDGNPVRYYYDWAGTITVAPL